MITINGSLPSEKTVELVEKNLSEYGLDIESNFAAETIYHAKIWS